MDDDASTPPASPEPGPVIGIDLGTTNSAVGTVEAGFPFLMADEDGHRLTPSAVFFPPDHGKPATGREALRARAAYPTRVVTSVKSLMGRRRSEVNPEPAYPLAGAPDAPVRIAIDDHPRTPEEISALILRRLVEIAENRLETTVKRAVITVPAYFNDAQRSATKRAGELAGLTVERILNEPTAAAMAYGLDKLGDRSKIAVYDFGGGTFDLSILELNAGVFEVLGTHGDTALGGDDIDRVLAEFLWDEAGGDGAFDRLDPAIAGRLLAAAEEAKRALSASGSVPVRIPFLGGGARHLEIELKRAQFERLAEPVIARTVPLCRQALADAGIEDPSALDAVVLVGGTTRVPAVRRRVAEVFGREPDTSQNPDEAVALGAAVQAGILSGALRDVVLLDVTPLSLGIETFGGLMNVIIPRNSTIPTKAGELFTNAVTGQAAMLIRVLQGEREVADANWELGKLEIPFEPGPKGSARVGVQFRLDENGILEVLARDTSSGRDVVLTLQDAAVDVDDAAVERMVSESVEHAFADMRERVWVEEKLKADELVAAVASALEVARGWIDPAEREAIESAARRVQEAGAGGVAHDVDALKGANRALDEATQGLAAALVDRAVEEGGPEDRLSGG